MADRQATVTATSDTKVLLLPLRAPAHKHSAHQETVALRYICYDAGEHRSQTCCCVTFPKHSRGRWYATQTVPFDRRLMTLKEYKSCQKGVLGACLRL